MTTRRRRAGSESYEEPTVLGAQSPHPPAPQCPPVQSQNILFSQGVGNVSGSWGTATPVDPAYYKKTDAVSPVQPPWPTHPHHQPSQGYNNNAIYPNQPLQPSQTSQWNHSGASWNNNSAPVNTWNNNSTPVIQNTWNDSAPVNTWNNNSTPVNSWNNNSVPVNTWNNNNTPVNSWNNPSTPVNSWNNPSTPGNNFSSAAGGSRQESTGYSGSSVSEWSGGVNQQPSLEDSDMASRDRTQEFARIVRSQQGSYSNGAVPHHEGKRPRDLRQYRDFMQRSKLIGRNISSTYAKLEKLTQLAKKRSLFDDTHDREIQELTGIIRHDLSSLTKQLTDLRNRSRIHDTNPTNTQHLQKHSSNLVGTLQTKVAFITRKFKDILEVRTENLKKQAERREQFTGGIVSGELPPGAVAGHHQGSVLLADEVAAALPPSTSTSNGEVAINLGGGGAAYQQQLQLMEEQDTLLQSRADTMHTIESTIVELGQMFSQLATMVKEQEELVHRIDANVEDAELNVEAAHSELLKYFKSVSSNRMLMVKVFGVMIVFFIIFIVFMA